MGCAGSKEQSNLQQQQQSARQRAQQPDAPRAPAPVKEPTYVDECEACMEKNNGNRKACERECESDASSLFSDLGDWIKQSLLKIVRTINEFFEDVAQNPDWYVPRLLALIVLIFIMIFIWNHFDAIKRAARGIKKRIQDFFAPPPLLPVFEQDCDPKINRVFPSTV